MPGCFSCGDTIEEANESVIDAIGLYLDDTDVPAPSEPQTITLENGEFVMLVAFDKLAYAKKHDTKSVKKNLTIPSWLNRLAEERHINFSSVLQAALKKELDIE